MSSLTSEQHIDFATELIQLFFEIELNVKLYHWQTSSFARHKATCGFLAAYTPLVDQFMETYFGHFPMVKAALSKIPRKQVTVEPTKENFTDLRLDSMAVKLNNFADSLKKLETHINLTDLNNIRDTILGQIKQTLYLFSFN